MERSARWNVDLFIFFPFFSRIPCRGTYLHNRVLHSNLQIDKSEIRIISNFIGIRYKYENKYFEICRIIARVSPHNICYFLCNYSTALSWNATQHCAPRANPFVNAQMKFLIRAVDQVKMYSTSFRLFYLYYDRYFTLFVAAAFRLTIVNSKIKRASLYSAI